jgi:hypothetical protein
LKMPVPKTLADARKKTAYTHTNTHTHTHTHTHKATLRATVIYFSRVDEISPTLTLTGACWISGASDQEL